MQATNGFFPPFEMTNADSAGFSLTRFQLVGLVLVAWKRHGYPSELLNGQVTHHNNDTDGPRQRLALHSIPTTETTMLELVIVAARSKETRCDGIKVKLLAKRNSKASKGNQEFVRESDFDKGYGSADGLWRWSFDKHARATTRVFHAIDTDSPSMKKVYSPI